MKIMIIKKSTSSFSCETALMLSSTLGSSFPDLAAGTEIDIKNHIRITSRDGLVHLALRIVDALKSCDYPYLEYRTIDP